MRRARLASVPGLSLPYQLRISRTRSLMVESSPLRWVGSLPVAAVASAAARPAAAALLRPVQPVAERLERRLVHPAHLGRVDLRVAVRSEEHTSELQSQSNLVCRLLLEKKKKRRRTREILWYRDRQMTMT